MLADSVNIDLTAEAVIRAMRSANIQSSSDVHFVQIKGAVVRALVASLADAHAGGRPASDNPGKLMGLGRAVSALGVAKPVSPLRRAAPSKAPSVGISRLSLRWPAVPRASKCVPTRSSSLHEFGMVRPARDRARSHDGCADRGNSRRALGFSAFPTSRNFRANRRRGSGPSL